MPFSENLADRVRLVLNNRMVVFTEKRMMGGLCYMVCGKMCLGILDERLMVRLDPEIYDASLKKPGCKPMDFTGKPMKGFVFIDPDGHDTKRQIEYWIDLALDFNPRAKSSKKRETGEKRARTNHVVRSAPPVKKTVNRKKP